MNHDDKMVLDYLGKYPTSFVSVMEVCKRAADRRRFAQQPDWARPILARLTQASMLECNASGQYKLKSKHEDEEPARRARVPRPGEGALRDAVEPSTETPSVPTLAPDQPATEPKSEAA
jgi:hypothetical protein